MKTGSIIVAETHLISGEEDDETVETLAASSQVPPPTSLQRGPMKAFALLLNRGLPPVVQPILLPGNYGSLAMRANNLIASKIIKWTTIVRR